MRKRKVLAKALKESGWESPNLDCLSIDPQDLKEAAEVFGLLAGYAKHVARAMELRLQGDVGAARCYELAAQRCYEELPKWARW